LLRESWGRKPRFSQYLRNTPAGISYVFYPQTFSRSVQGRPLPTPKRSSLKHIPTFPMDLVCQARCHVCGHHNRLEFMTAQVLIGHLRRGMPLQGLILLSSGL